ncbi:MAG TPA: hypothetical protein VLG38_05555 [Gammaproteobacteria bacterium]|nr:hypothetical protein [Gammaproteobacteria bacterium]
MPRLDQRLEQPQNQERTHEPEDNYLQRSFVRLIGHIFGRIVATIGAATTMRVLTRGLITNRRSEREDDDMDTIIQALQSEVPVAATTLVTWNMRVGARTGADVTEYLFDSIANMTFRYITQPAQQSRGYFVAFTDRLTDNLTGHLMSTATQAVQGIMRSVDQQRSPRLHMT